jgi:SAM-dependent methyltransferase
LTCNYCGSIEHNDLFEAESHNKNYKISICNHCSLVCLNPIPSRKDLDLFYSNSYNYDDFLSNKDYLKNRAKLHVKYIQKFKTKGKLLEIGCMYGFFMKEAQNHGFEVYGLEKSSMAAEYGRKELGLNIHSSDLADAKFKKNFFDVIYMSHVIEHISDPHGELKKIFNLLKPEGVLILRCPNFSSLAVRIMQQRWSWLCPPEHIYQFTSITLSNMLISAGFKIKSKKTSGGDKIYLRYLGVEFFNYLPIKKIKKIEFRAKIDNHPNHWSQKFLLGAYKILYPVIKLMHFMGLGQELIIVAEKEKVENILI